MFTRNFALNVIAPAGQGQPFFIAGPIAFEVHTLLLSPAVFNTLFAGAQLLLAGLILWKRTARYGLIGSVVWGIAVWFWGEGLGGLASGHTSLLMGAPGAALLYALIALAVMPAKAPTVAKSATRPAPWLALVWVAVWVGGAVYQLLPGQNTPADVSAVISGNAEIAPGWLAGLDQRVANLVHGTTSGMHMAAGQVMSMPMPSSHIAGAGEWLILLLVGLQALIGLAILWPGHGRKVAVGAGVLLCLIFWVVGQSFGTLYSGLATDPNSAPLIILLGVAALGGNAMWFGRPLPRTASSALGRPAG